MRVWTYWQGPMPPIIGLCHATASHFYDDVVHLTPETFKELPGGADELDRIKHVKKACHRADVLRLWLLTKYPDSVWMDSDFLHIKPINFDDVHPTADLIGVGNSNPNHFPNAPLYSRTGKAAREAHKRALQVTGGDYYRYGSNILRAMAKDEEWGPLMFKAARQPWLSNLEFGAKKNILKPSSYNPNSHMYHFSSRVTKWIRTRSLADLRNVETPIGRLIIATQEALE